MSELEDGIQELHKMGPQTVAISSTDIDEKLTSIVSTAKGNSSLTRNSILSTQVFIE